ncbi:glycine betaine ABC transporter substrate-binding protein [Euzebya sp.]|uniref:ABC transporter substrate-binding protein n=1 Tax=Euzebya sp. TaxID=1971409 RepID=UPI0035137A93
MPAPTASRRSARRFIAPVLALLVAVALTACDGADDPRPIRVGAGSTTEQQVLAALTAGLLDRDGHPAEVVPDLGDTTDVREAALDGDIDVYWDYSGATWALALGLTAPPIDAQESYEAVAAEEEGNGLRWLTSSGVDARLAFFVRPEALTDAEDATLTWLAGELGQVDGALCADPAFLDAPSGYAYLADTYAIAPDATATRGAGEEEALRGTAEGTCIAGMASATSGLARELGLVALTDDQGVFPAQVVAPVVRLDTTVLDDRAERLVGSLSAELTTDALADLNAEAQAGTPIDQVAGAFLDASPLGGGG